VAAAVAINPAQIKGVKALPLVMPVVAEASGWSR
jgi:hypothetical protein